MIEKLLLLVICCYQFRMRCNWILSTSQDPVFRGSGGRLCTRFLGSQVGSQVHADGSGQGRKGHGLVCTRSQGPHLYTRPRASSVHAEWFCCMYTFVLTAVYFVCSMCARCQVQVFSSLTAVYFVCSMCAGCQVHNNAFWTCVKYVPKQSIPWHFEHGLHYRFGHV